MKKPQANEVLGSADEPFNDRSFAEEWPSVHDHLTSIQYEGGQSRMTSTLLLFVENGVLRICLNDRDNQRSAFFTGTCFADAMASLEAGLSSGRAEWRRKGSGGGVGGRVPF